MYREYLMTLRHDDPTERSRTAPRVPWVILIILQYQDNLSTFYSGNNDALSPILRQITLQSQNAPKCSFSVYMFQSEPRVSVLSVSPVEIATQYYLPRLGHRGAVPPGTLYIENAGDGFVQQNILNVFRFDW